MNKRVLAIVVGSAIALALIVGAIVFLVAREGENNLEKDRYRFDEAERMGVAQLLSKNDVERATDGIATDVKGPESDGVLHLDKVRAEVARFKFDVDGHEVVLNVDVRVYPEGRAYDEQLDPKQVFRAVEGDVIDGIGDEARIHFPLDDVTTGERKYSLIALDGRTVIVINLDMPAGGEVALSRSAGEKILTDLGRRIDLGNLK